ncbi:hypothetical protein AVEN_172741-1 [Araneus ventricosus]|uniref:Uncharacterized protein n=1 Tax=Araneus ventricosus TaxID=182803 RepID=A0A4Y2BKP8_ARAVE|nr:hypothetical protein AVEN_172741-1 [Araneus ventricosus]
MSLSDSTRYPHYQDPQFTPITHTTTRITVHPCPHQDQDPPVHPLPTTTTRITVHPSIARTTTRHHGSRFAVKLPRRHRRQDPPVHPSIAHTCTQDHGSRHPLPTPPRSTVHTHPLHTRTDRYVSSITHNTKTNSSHTSFPMAHNSGTTQSYYQDPQFSHHTILILPRPKVLAPHITYIPVHCQMHDTVFTPLPTLPQPIELALYILSTDAIYTPVRSYGSIKHCKARKKNY